MASLQESYIHNLDEDRALALLAECNDAIARLNIELQEKNQRKRLLEERILAVRGRRSSLNRIPDELMLEIYKAATQDDSLALGPILWVCRKWHQIAVNSPALWTTITVNLKNMPNAAAIQRGTKYLKSAIRCSKQAPLDVNLTLPSKGEFIENISLRILEMKKIDIEDAILRYGTVHDWVEEGMELNSHLLTPYEEITNTLSDFMEALAGSNGENLLRLRSFELDYNPNNFEDWIQNGALYHPTPILEQLRIRIQIADSTQPLPDPIFIHPAPRLSRVSVDARYPINMLLGSNATVKSLEFDFDPSQLTLDAFPDHSLLRNLKYLRLNCCYKQSPRENSQDILLPSLEDLTLWGTYGSNCIKAPKLTTLRLFGGGEFEFEHAYFPSLRKLHLYSWLLHEGKAESLWNYLDQHPYIEEIGIVHSGDIMVKHLVAELGDGLENRTLAIKEYRAELRELLSWSPPFHYEANEIDIS